MNPLAQFTPDTTRYEGRHAPSHQPSLETLEPRLLLDGALEWAEFLGGTGYESAAGVATDGGYVYAVGTLSTATDADAFVAKFDAASGAVSGVATLGGGGFDQGYGIAVAGGSVYIAGSTTSSVFDTEVPGGYESILDGFQDAFVAKLDAGSLALQAWTYLSGDGGGTGFDPDAAFGVAVDPATGNVLVTGTVAASSVTGPDVFVAQLDAALKYRPGWTYLGGTGVDQGKAIALDGSGNVYVTGVTMSAGIAFTSQPSGVIWDVTIEEYGLDGFAAKLSSGLVLEYLTYIGGDMTDEAWGIAADSAGNAYVAGVTFSPTWGGVVFQGGPRDGFVLKLVPDGSTAEFVTPLGGLGDAAAYGLALDGEGGVLITGETSTDDWAAGDFVGLYDAFLAQIDAEGALVSATYLGGASMDIAKAIAFDGAGGAYLAGETFDSSWAVAARPEDVGGGLDAFVAKAMVGAPELSGFVFDDVNNNGVFEPEAGEEGIAGVTMLLKDDTGTVVDTVLTGSDGSYAFTSVEPGTYSIEQEAQPEGYLDGSEAAGDLGGVVDNTQDSNVISDIVVDSADGPGYSFAEIKPSEIHGVVWEDFNADGAIDFGEGGIGGVTIQLTGADDRGLAVSETTETIESGVYAFPCLRPGSYTITEVQPAGYVDGTAVLGTVNAVPTGVAGENRFTGVALPEPGMAGENYSFSERPEAGGQITSGQAATVFFWTSWRGQRLLKELNGGAQSTQLGNWLAATLPNMFGTGAGDNNLAGKTNAQVADFYGRLMIRSILLWWRAPRPALLEVRALAAALSVYVTNEALAGTAAQAYGFVTSTHGLGVSVINVGSSGEAFGVDDNTVMTVLDLLLATNERTVGGILYDDGNGSINATEFSLRQQANWTYLRIIVDGL